MDFQLFVVRGRSASEALNLADGVTTLGRQDECQIRIKSSQVSRRHCEFFEKKGLLIVKDLGSANGTYVNEKKVEGQQVLEPGDELTIGPVKLRVAKVGQAPPVRTPAPAGVGETAVVEALTLPEDGGDDEFEIDFDDDPTSATTTDVKPATTAPEPVTKPAPPAPKKGAGAPAAKAATEPAPGPAPAAPDMADEAIADFLLDLKLDEDE